MSVAQPKTYQAFDAYLAISWQDGHESLLTFPMLRDACPCANCKGEPDLLGRIYRPAQEGVRSDEGNRLVGLQAVGHYGLQLVWGDGHSTGIYTFAYLRRLCDCQACQAEKVAGS